MILKTLYRFRSCIFAKQPQSSIRNFCNMAMGDQSIDLSSFTVDEVLEKLESFAPLSLAESWDNVGLLIEPSYTAKIKNIMLTNDLTEDVVLEAASKSINLVITYHPNIFHGMKNVTLRTWKERVVMGCIKNNISVFSPHTSWDAIDGGVNDWLSNAFSAGSIKPIEPRAGNNKVGAGRLVVLDKPITIQQAVDSIKGHIKLDHIRLAIARGRELDSTITTVAICAGSGVSVLRGVTADLYFTGEMLHHDILEATQNGISVILTNHSDSERGFLTHIQSRLQKDVFDNRASILVSKVDTDPLKTV